MNIPEKATIPTYMMDLHGDCPWLGEFGDSNEQSLLPRELRWMAAFLPVGELVLSGRKWSKLAKEAAAVSPIPPSNPKRKL